MKSASRHGHVALIVEDDPHVAEVLAQLVTSLGHGWIHVSTLEEVRGAVPRGGYCYALLDMQIPADALSDPAVGCGETALRLIRRANPERHHDTHRVPILVVTGYSREPEFVSKVHKKGANDFISKDFGDRPDKVLDTIREALKEAGREEHEDCAKPGGEAAAKGEDTVVVAGEGDSTPPAARKERPPVRITLDGTCSARRNDVIVDGKRASLQDGIFLVLLHMIVVHLRSPGEWESPTKLGMARNAWAPSRIRAALADVLPAELKLVEANKVHGFRLNPAVVIERVEWGALGKHPLAAVRKAAAEGMKVVEGARRG